MKEKDLVSEPIFLVGAERSGTTVLRLMLSHHPQIAWCNEFEYTVDRIPNGDGWPQLEDYYEWLETHRIFQATGFAIDRSLSYPQLVNSFLLQKQNQERKSLIGATVHRHFDKLLRIWSDARFIHLVRDGRDVARSCIGMGWAGNVWTGVEGWIEAEQLWTQLKDIIPPERRTEVNYETLISEPTKTLTRLCEFIDVPYDEAMLSYAQNTTYDLPDPKLIQQWRRKLSEDEIQLVESRIAAMLVDRGYELSGLPSLDVTPAMARRLRFQDWYARVQFRIQRQGLPLFFAEYFSRKLGFKSISFGVNGVVGLIAIFGASLLPALSFVWLRYPASSWFNSKVASAAVLVVVITLYMVDCSLNNQPNPVFTLASGGVAGVVLKGRESNKLRGVATKAVVSRSLAQSRKYWHN